VDRPLIRRALVGLVEERPELQLEAVVRDGEAALTAISEHLPDVALIEARLPRRQGHAMLMAMRAQGLETPIVLLTGPGALVPGPVGAGSATCLSSDADEDQICATLVAAVRGHPAPDRDSSSDRPSRRLSARELEILELAASSRSGDAIADHLRLSPATVRTYLTRIYDKLGVTGRAAAVAQGIRQGLI
jgi:two-component system, NarL family, nitrate/nitrite response regulator NarL